MGQLNLKAECFLYYISSSIGRLVAAQLYCSNSICSCILQSILTLCVNLSR